MAARVLRRAGAGALLRLFYEYALEPAVLSSWDRTRFFLDAFGPWKGRFLAEYPKRWKKMVYDGLSCGDVEKKRIVERLSIIDKRVFSSRSGAAYDPGRSWIDNAEVEHQRLQFRAIIAAEVTGRPHVLDGADVDDRHDRWRAEPGCLIAKDSPDILVKALRLLLHASKRVVVIDPYFEAEKDEKRRPLVALWGALLRTTRIEVHLSDKKRTFEYALQRAEEALPKFLPDGMEVELCCWRERDNGPRLHNRYLLTDVGGVKFGDGIEVGSPGHLDHLSILDESSRLALWSQLFGEPPGFESAGTPRSFRGGAGLGR